MAAVDTELPIVEVAASVPAIVERPLTATVTTDALLAIFVTAVSVEEDSVACAIVVDEEESSSDVAVVLGHEHAEKELVLV